MNVVRWSVVAAAAMTAVAGLVAGPIALAEGTSPAASPIPPVAALAGHSGIGMVSPGTALLTFVTSDPLHAAVSKPVGGLNGDRLIGIDYRPNDHKLYAVGYSGRVYRVDDLTAAATSIGKLSVKLSGPTDGKGFDIDFTPNGSDLRIISATGQNIHQPFGASGPSGKTVTDGKLSRKQIAAMAYDDGGRLIDIDTTNAQVVLQDPKTGKITDLGPKGTFPGISTTSNGIDIVGSDSFAVVNLNHNHTLYSVNGTNGSVSKIGVFPDHVLDIALSR
jgi:hypothetical protein